MTVCGGWSLQKHSASGSSAITLWCRSWLCPDCMPRRLTRLKLEARDGNPTTFLTLTVNPATNQSADQRARELVDAMRTMLKRARRRWKKSPIEYFAVFEETKQGEPHLHLLMRAPYVPQKWISNTMKALINAPIVDIRRVTNARSAARYVAKYVAKGPKSFGTLKRYWKTKNYDQGNAKAKHSEPDACGQWWVVQEPLFIIAEHWRTLQRMVVWVSENEIFSGNGDGWRGSG